MVQAKNRAQTQVFRSRNSSQFSRNHPGNHTCLEAHPQHSHASQRWATLGRSFHENVGGMLCSPRVRVTDDGHTSQAAPSSYPGLRREFRTWPSVFPEMSPPPDWELSAWFKAIIGKKSPKLSTTQPSLIHHLLPEIKTSQAPIPSSTSPFSNCPTCTLCITARSL